MAGGADSAPPSSARNSGPHSRARVKVDDTIVSKDNDMVELLGNQFQLLFTIEDDSNIALFQSQILTEATMWELGNIKHSDTVRAYLKRI